MDRIDSKIGPGQTSVWPKQSQDFIAVDEAVMICNHVHENRALVVWIG
jgi:hypothetical protein